MKRIPFVLPLVLLLSARPVSAADDTALVKAHGTLVFEDDFNRKETSPDKEDVGNGWTTNSATRAKNAKQASLEDDALHLATSPVADHNVAIRHETAFQDGAVQLRFKLTEGEDLGVELLDPELKTAHAGHISKTLITLKELTLLDQKTGVMRNAVRERRAAKDKSPDLEAMLKSKTVTFPLNLTADHWYTLLIVFEGDQLRATIDEKSVGDLKSEGFAHPTKRVVLFNASKSAWVDDLKVWKLPLAATNATP